MKLCDHTHLTLLPEASKRLRCRHCHLTIKAAELTRGYCPECLESEGKKRYDFEEIEAEKLMKARYRCEKCGAIIQTE